jgi:hypothetical protein
MATIALPAGFAALPLRGVSWRVREPAQRNRSAWTGTSKKIGLPGATTWSATGQFAAIPSEREALPWRAFFLSLRGIMNAFPVHAVEAQQTSASNPFVRSSGRTDGDSLPLAGLPANSTVLVAGRMISVTLPSGHQRLAGLLADLVTDGAGEAVAQLSLELGEVPFAGAAAEIRWPWSRMALKEPETGWDVDLIQYGFSIDAEEDR